MTRCSASTQPGEPDGSSVEGLRHAEKRSRPVASTPDVGAPGPRRAGGLRPVRRPRLARRHDHVAPRLRAHPGSWGLLNSARRPSSTTRTQACRALRGRGACTNPRLQRDPSSWMIMTDPDVAGPSTDLEPLTVEAVEAVIAKERPMALAGLGGAHGPSTSPRPSPSAASSSATTCRLLGTRSRRSGMAERRGVPRPARPGQRPAVRAILDRRDDRGCRDCVVRDRAARDRPGGSLRSVAPAAASSPPRRSTVSASAPACAQARLVR